MLEIHSQMWSEDLKKYIQSKLLFSDYFGKFA